MNYKNTEESQIIEFRKGNEKALRYIFDAYYPSLCYYAQSIVYDVHAAQDIASETFVKLWQLHYRFNNEDAIKSFLFTSVRNACFNFLKKEQRKTAREKDFYYLLEMYHEHYQEEMLLVTLLQQVYVQIEMLPHRQRQIFKLLFLRGKDVSNVAASMGLSEQTVRNHKTRALRHMRILLLKWVNGLSGKRQNHNDVLTASHLINRLSHQKANQTKETKLAIKRELTFP